MKWSATPFYRESYVGLLHNVDGPTEPLEYRSTTVHQSRQRCTASPASPDFRALTPLVTEACPRADNAQWHFNNCRGPSCGHSFWPVGQDQTGGSKESGYQPQVPKTMSPAHMNELCTSFSTFTPPNPNEAPWTSTDAHPSSPNTFQTWWLKFSAVILQWLSCWPSSHRQVQVNKKYTCKGKWSC